MIPCLTSHPKAVSNNASALGEGVDKMMPFKHIVVLLPLIIGLLRTTLSYGADYTKTPVFFVHGYGMPADSWQPLMTYLQQQSDYPSLFLKAIQLVPDNGANIAAAENQIAPAIEEFLEEANNDIVTQNPDIPPKTEIDLVSHSMGGLSTRWYTARLRPDRVRKWISLAGANHGTNDVCPPGFSGQGADDLCPAYANDAGESLIQYELNGAPYIADVDETPYGIGTDSPGVDSIPPDQNRRVLYVTVRTSPDEWIDPEDSVVLDGAGGAEIPIPGNLPAEFTSAGNILMKNGVGHDEILEDPDTMRLVSIALHAPTITTTTNGIGGGGSCFIAAAEYESHVMKSHRPLLYPTSNPLFPDQSAGKAR